MSSAPFCLQPEEEGQLLSECAVFTLRKLTMEISYKDLLTKRQELDARIEQARKAEIGAAVEKARSIIAEYELQVQDVFPSGRGARSLGPKARVAPKYRNPETGQTWSGRGKPPIWIAGKDRSAFGISGND